jgi:hypothetical protein
MIKGLPIKKLCYAVHEARPIGEPILRNLVSSGFRRYAQRKNPDRLLDARVQITGEQCRRHVESERLWNHLLFEDNLFPVRLFGITLLF